MFGPLPEDLRVRLRELVERRGEPSAIVSVGLGRYTIRVCLSGLPVSFETIAKVERAFR